MTDMEFVEKVIDGLIDDYENQKNDSKHDALDVSYFNCSIGTLRLLKYRLGIV